MNDLILGSFLNELEKIAADFSGTGLKRVAKPKMGYDPVAVDPFRSSPRRSIPHPFRGNRRAALAGSEITSPITTKPSRRKPRRIAGVMPLRDKNRWGQTRAALGRPASIGKPSASKATLAEPVSDPWGPRSRSTRTAGSQISSLSSSAGGRAHSSHLAKNKGMKFHKIRQAARILGKIK